MASSVASGNEFLEDLDRPVRTGRPSVVADTPDTSPHLHDNPGVGSPPNSTPPAGAAHVGADPAAGAKGSV